ncbi:type IV secretion system immunity protein Tsi1 [Pseudomonas aeruginosa]
MKLLVGSFAALFLSLSAQAADCTFTQLEIVPQFGSPNMFGGEDEHVRVMFSNEDPNDDNPDAFPEPPVYLADRDSGNDCRIEDGGIWSRGGVFLSQDGRRVLMHEFSGSSAELVSYDSATCKVVHREDISGQRWAVDKDGLRLGQKCSGESVDSCAKIVKRSLAPFCQTAKK